MRSENIPEPGIVDPEQAYSMFSPPQCETFIDQSKSPNETEKNEDVNLPNDPPVFKKLDELSKVAEAIKTFENDTKSKFSVFKKDKSFGKSEFDLTGHKLLFEDNKLEDQDEKEIEFNGSPFIILGNRCYECTQVHHDLSKKRKWQVTCSEEKSTTDIFLSQPSKEINCPAKIVVRDVIFFPDYKIDVNTEERKRNCVTKLKNDWSHKVLTTERFYFVSFPSIDAHKGHLLDDKFGASNMPSSSELNISDDRDNSQSMTVTSSIPQQNDHIDPDNNENQSFGGFVHNANDHDFGGFNDDNEGDDNDDDDVDDDVDDNNDDDFISFHSLQELSDAIRNFELDTNTKYNTKSSYSGFDTETDLDMYLLKIKSEKDIRIWWQFVSMNDNTPIKYNGIPFVILNKKIYTCHQGKDENKAKNDKKRERKMKLLGLSYKSRKMKKPTKKLNCPVQFTVKKLLYFPDFQVKGAPTKYNKVQISKKLRTSLCSLLPNRTNPENVDCVVSKKMKEEASVSVQLVFVTKFPFLFEHKYHHVGLEPGITDLPDGSDLEDIKEIENTFVGETSVGLEPGFTNLPEDGDFGHIEDIGKTVVGRISVGLKPGFTNLLDDSDLRHIEEIEKSVVSRISVGLEPGFTDLPDDSDLGYINEIEKSVVSRISVGLEPELTNLPNSDYGHIDELPTREESKTNAAKQKLILDMKVLIEGVHYISDPAQIELLQKGVDDLMRIVDEA